MIYGYNKPCTEMTNDMMVGFLYTFSFSLTNYSNSSCHVTNDDDTIITFRASPQDGGLKRLVWHCFGPR